MVRKPVVAGQFYPGSEKKLRDGIEECFLHDLGPGKIPKNEGDSREIKGLVVPHAGYVYSGPVAAHSYKTLYEDGLPETIVLIGPNHHGYGPGAAMADDDFETPLGIVPVDKDIVNSLEGDILKINSTAHSGEHSLEVQLPFLQFFSDDFKIVPITLLDQSQTTAVEIGKKLREVLGDKDYVVIASTDFSHYVARNTAEKLDKMVIEYILKYDIEGMYRTIQQNNITMCGYGAVASMLKGVNGEKAELLKYATSGDISNMREVVGYGALSVK